MCYTYGELYNCVDYKIASHIGYCCVDKISKLEIINMAKELNLHVEGSTFWWMEVNGGKKSLVEIKI